MKETRKFFSISWINFFFFLFSSSSHSCIFIDCIFKIFYLPILENGVMDERNVTSVDLPPG